MGQPTKGNRNGSSRCFIGGALIAAERVLSELVAK